MPILKNPKHENAVTETEKIAALQQLGKMIGAWRPANPTELIARQANLTEKDIWSLVIGMMAVGRTDPQRAATGMLLDYYFPGWKDSATESAIGATVNRDSAEVRLWRKAVLKRDKFTCRSCGESKESLDAHHIVRWVDAPHMRVCVENGVALCRLCHINTHKNKGCSTSYRL